MYVLAGQHPYLAALVPRLLNALTSPIKLSHLLPHNVRLNPLFLNTTNHKRRKCEICSNKKICLIETNRSKDVKKQERKLRKILAM